VSSDKQCASRQRGRRLRLNLPDATTLRLGPGAPAWLPPVVPRAYASTVHLSSGTSAVVTGTDAVRLPLPGGWVTTAWRGELRRVVAAVAALDEPFRITA
jgi:urease accessory protein